MRYNSKQTHVKLRGYEKSMNSEEHWRLTHEEGSFDHPPTDPISEERRRRVSEEIARRRGCI
jgi:hypothetical protein